MTEVVWSPVLRRTVRADEIIARWREGQNTHEIAFGLFMLTGGALAPYEARVCRIIRAEQDRRYRERTTARLTAEA